MNRGSFRAIIHGLRRRRVLNTLALYIVGAWVALQVADLAFESWCIDSSALRYVWFGAALGLPIALVFGWRYDITRHGMVRTPPIDAGHNFDHSLRRPDLFVLAFLVVVTVGIIYQLALHIFTGRTFQPAFYKAVQGSQARLLGGQVFTGN